MLPVYSDHSPAYNAEAILGLEFHLRDRDDLEAVIIRNLIERVANLTVDNQFKQAKINRLEQAISDSNFVLVAEQVEHAMDSIFVTHYTIKSKRTLARQAKNK
jgi:hypothetical protein